MRDGHFSSPLGQVAYRTGLAAFRAGGRTRSRSFGAGKTDCVGRIYVINLDRHTARWSQTRRELSRLRDERGLPFTELSKRLSAVDGRYDISAPKEVVQPEYCLADQLHVDPHPLPAGVGDPAMVPIEMSREEVAVALSHVKAWELIAAGESQYCLVLEDDVYFRRAFAKEVDRAWSQLGSKLGSTAFDLLYVSYEEARGGADWAETSGWIRRPRRGLWQLSGYVLSRRGADRLLKRLPVRGPVDLWINLAFNDLDVIALRRPMIKQRRDVPSSNYYSAQSVLSKVGVLTGEKAPLFEQPPTQGPIFGTGIHGSGRTALASALSMLGYRCCSDIADLPDAEREALFDRTRPRVFDAYVNIGSLGPPELLKLSKIHPNSRFIITTLDENDRPRFDSISNEAPAAADTCPVSQVLSGLDGTWGRLLKLPASHRDKWLLLTEFLGCAYPSHRFPQEGDRLPRPLRHRQPNVPAVGRPRGTALRWDPLPWIAATAGWHGVSLRDSSHDHARYVEKFDSPWEERWEVRDDTFPGNLSLFSPGNFASVDDGASRITLCRQRTAVRDYTSAAVSTRDRYRYGRFAADLKPANIGGLVTGMFLHRNAPRQEIDIEFLGTDTTKMLVNVYFNPGEDGTRLEYGYRGTPEIIELGFDAAKQYHRYEIEWTPDGLRWRVDGELVCEREHWDPTPIPHLGMRFHINLWYTRSAGLAGRLARRKLPAHTYLRRVELTSDLRVEA